MTALIATSIAIQSILDDFNTPNPTIVYWGALLSALVYPPYSIYFATAFVGLFPFHLTSQLLVFRPLSAGG
jgi:hypothetical protein